MATVPFRFAPVRGEARFFFFLTVIMAMLIIAGFSLNAVLGRAVPNPPLLVHLHGAIMVAWMALFMLQSFLISANNVALHRRLGWLSVLFVPVILVTGAFITRWSMQTHGGPPVFDQNQFLFSSTLHLWAMAAIVAWAVGVRRNTGWHRRLMICGLALLLGPGVGRLLPTPFFIPYAWYISVVLPAILFPVIGMIADKRRHGRVHPAWFWGVGIIIAVQIAGDIIAYSDTGVRFTEWFVAGTPGADRPTAAFFPPA